MSDQLTNISSNNKTQAPPSPFGGAMNQVGSGPAGILYSLADQLIKIYNEMQDLYNKVSNQETLVQQDTILAGAQAQREGAKQQMYSIICQATESLAGAAVTIGTSFAENYNNKEIDDAMSQVEAEKAPLTKLDAIQRNQQAPFSRTLGSAEPNATNIRERTTQLKNGNYDYNGPCDPQEINQKAVNGMSDDEFNQFKKDLDTKIMDKERRINTLQSRRQTEQQTRNSYGQIFSSGTTTALKGGEAAATANAGDEQASQQTLGAVQQMATSTADSSRGSIGQDYAKVSDLIASARQGAQSYAQT